MASLTRTSLDKKLAMAKRCSHEGVVAGTKAAIVASVAAAIPTVRYWLALGCFHGPGPTSNTIYGQALIVSSVAGMAYFIVPDKTILASARKNSFKPNAA